MIFKLHKIPDRFIFRVIFALLILWNLKYLFLIVQIPFTMLFVDYLNSNSFYSQVKDIKSTIVSVKDFQDEGKIGFLSDTQESSVFDYEDSIRNFYLAQYAIVPSILKNDKLENYVIGAYEYTPQKITAPDNFMTYKKINNRTYLYKRIKD